MQMLQFKLANLFSLLIFVAGVLGCILRFSLLKTFSIIVLVSMAIAFLNSRERNPVVLSGLTGAAFATTLIVVVYLYVWTDYLVFYKGARPYFMDGAIEEGLIYPCVCLAIFVPIGAMIGFASGFPILLRNWTKNR